MLSHVRLSRSGVVGLQQGCKGGGPQLAAPPRQICHAFVVHQTFVPVSVLHEGQGQVWEQALRPCGHRLLSSAGFESVVCRVRVMHWQSVPLLSMLHESQ